LLLTAFTDSAKLSPQIQQKLAENLKIMQTSRLLTL